jgi:FkbM family methyltransferase
MKRFGTTYGGWNIPETAALDSNSIIYSGGVGEDISFDLLLHDTYKTNIYLIDPTKRASKHYEEVKEFYMTRKPYFSGDIQKDYIRTIGHCKPDFSKFTYISKGLWSKQGTLKFYKPTNEKYVSHTLIENMYSDNYDTVEVDSIKNIMDSFSHTHINLLKLDIEGSEIAVVDQMLKDAIFPDYICIEFDLRLKNVDYRNETGGILTSLSNAGYTMADNNNWNCLFIRS